MEEEAIASLQAALGKNAFLTLSKRIGQENKALGRYAEESMTPRAVEARRRKEQGRRRRTQSEEEGAEEEVVEVEEEGEDGVDIFGGPEQDEEYRPVARDKSTSTMRDTPEEPQNEDEFGVVDDEEDKVLDGWRGVKEEEEERHAAVGRSWDIRQDRDERSKSKKRQPGSPQAKKVMFDSRVKVEENHNRVMLEDEDSP